MAQSLEAITMPEYTSIRRLARPDVPSSDSVGSVFAMYAVPSGTSALLTMKCPRHVETVLCHLISIVVCTLLTEAKRSESTPPSHREDIITKLRLRLYIALQHFLQLTTPSPSPSAC